MPQSWKWLYQNTEKGKNLHKAQTPEVDAVQKYIFAPYHCSPASSIIDGTDLCLCIFPKGGS